MQVNTASSMQLASLTLLPLIAGSLVLLPPAVAQEDPLAARRAINFARDSAVSANGGLRLYHPASCMFKDPTNNPCLVLRDANGFKFQFIGGRAGWEVLGLPATVESTVHVSPDGQTSIKEFHRKLGNTSLPITTDLMLPNEVSQPLQPGDTSF